VTGYERGVLQGVVSGASFTAVVLLRGVPAIVAFVVNLASYWLLRPPDRPAPLPVSQETR